MPRNIDIEGQESHRRGSRPRPLLRELKTRHDRNDILVRTLNATLFDVRKRLGSDESEWKWGNLHKAYFRHPLHVPTLDLVPHARPRDAYTVNATGGPGYRQSNGASYREIIDVSDWDRSMMTNVPGESGVPGDRHYGDLIDDWADGRYHTIPCPTPEKPSKPLPKSAFSCYLPITGYR
jgi:acyl-homoserine lactone acylase PvdQ